MKKARFQEITSEYARLKIGVLGDFSLDRYLEIDPALGETSIETGLPVHNVVNVRGQPGAAGTILNNLVALGVKAAYPVGFCGKDGEGYELQHALRAKGPSVPIDYFLATPHRRTFTYCKPLLIRPGRGPEELSRLDTKNWTPTPRVIEETLIDSVRRLVGEVDALIVLDQVDVAETGVVTRRVLEALHEASQARPDLLILADSRRGVKGWPPLTFKMNVNELASMMGQSRPLAESEVGGLAKEFARQTARVVFVTMAERGMMAASPEGRVERVDCVPPRGEIDVVGAGDSVTANLAVALAAGAGLREAIELANTAASIVIHQLGTTGTASVTQLEELLVGSMTLA
ncbi:MAG: carbohydrate kinase [Verrucomicrobia bacterium]|nr:carbohydrate kinase [Verrucomicrobiota bacterium]MBI3870382.1 carbohydrate kinase [Verrucomicrobiota bacterium]